MMYWNGHGAGVWDWFAMSLGSVFFLALFAIALFSLLRWLGRDRRFPTAPPALPEQLLAERFARGEIDVEEYRQRMDVLRETRSRADRG
ncbi:putative membrane protein [Streptomyces sp. 846.5]|nr:SHOCT domain-containing protein [Streptomyces sp. 846.5]TDT97372.1 putative membrane protein [Streptomyces sp. 846.5]